MYYRLFLLLFMFFSVAVGMSSFALGAQSTETVDTCCICQTDEPFSFYEGPMYKTACALRMLSKRGCDLKKTVEFDMLSIDNIPRRCDGAEVRMTFVGHWASSDQTRRYLEMIFNEGIIDRGMSFDIDNTGCLAMEEPYEIESFFSRALIPEGQYLRFKGSQVTSISLWDNFFGPLSGRVNFTASYDSRDGKFSYPSCSEYRGHQCAARFDIQGGERATCEGEDGELEELVCCTMTRTITPRLNRGRGHLRTVTSDMWLPEDRCSSIPDPWF